MAGRSERALPARRAQIVDTASLHGVVIDIDASPDPTALAVLQAGLHELPEGTRLIHGYDLEAVGLGAWVGDRGLRVTVWPALIDADGEIEAGDPDDPDGDVLVVDIDPLEHGAELVSLAATGRLIIAGPDAGPVPLVLDLDLDLLAELLAQLGIELA